MELTDLPTDGDVPASYRFVLLVVRLADEPLTVADVVNHTGCSRTTVYRALSHYVDEGEIEELPATDGRQKRFR